MKASFSNKLAMYLTVVSVLDKNLSLWQPLAALGTAFGKLKASITKINTLEQSLSGGTKGVTAGKRAKRIAMAETAAAVAGAIGAYASENGKPELLAKVDFSASDILRVRDTESSNIAQAIHDSPNGDLPALAEFGVTADTLTDLQAKIDAYTGNVSGPRTARSNNRASGEMLDAEFAVADTVLEKQIDGLLAKFKTIEPEFHAAYVAAREIVDNPGGHKGKNGHGTPPPTPQPGQ